MCVPLLNALCVISQSKQPNLCPGGYSFSADQCWVLCFSAFLKKRIEFTAEHRAGEGSVFLCHRETQNSLHSGKKNRFLTQRSDTFHVFICGGWSQVVTTNNGAVRLPLHSNGGQKSLWGLQRALSDTKETWSVLEVCVQRQTEREGP